jgi:hypothetical protein
MRIHEIASAEEQIALLKLIMDKTWEALTTQKRQQASQLNTKASPKPKTLAKSKVTKTPYTPPPLPKPQQKPLAKRAPQNSSPTLTASTSSTIKPMPPRTPLEMKVFQDHLRGVAGKTNQTNQNQGAITNQQSK